MAVEKDRLFDLSGKVVIVTGAGSGLGRAFSEVLAFYGAKVMCADRDASRAEETEQLIRDAGNEAQATRADVTETGSVAAMIERTTAAYGRVDVLINNAGIITRPARTHELAVEDWDRLLDINLKGVFLCTRAALPALLSAGGGSIINIASIVGLVGLYPNFPCATASYAAAKAGIVGFTRQVAAEYARDNIRVNAIAPGFHSGTRLAEERKESSPLEGVERFDAAIVRRTPQGRKGKPTDLGGLVVYLASDASNFVTGQVFAHDGGWTAT